jgi:cysteine desulfurase/selenocysteine lyase
MFPITKIRSQFPLLNREINKQKLIYFDNAATSQKPQEVIDAISNYYQLSNANVHRGIHTLSQEATDAYEKVRFKIQSHFNIKYTHEIIFTKGTTESINLVANGFSQLLKKGDEVILSYLEHHANIIPWQLACQKSGAILRVIPINQKGEIDLNIYQNLLSKNTKIVAVSHVSNTLGTVNPIRKIINLAHKYQVAVLIDGAQATAHTKIDMQDLDCEFYCTSAHKMYGPTGVGILYGKEEWLNKLPPYQGGGEMIKEVTFKKTTYADLPFKFEAGTPNIAGVIAFGAAIDYLNQIGLVEIAKYENELLNYATEQLEKIDELTIIGTASKKVAVISFIVKEIHPLDIGSIIDKFGIATRTGHHCSQPIMQFFKISGTIRISFAFYNTKKEIDVFITALKKAILMLQ